MNLIFFRLIEVSTKKRENYINARSALLQKFSVLFFGCHTNSDDLKGVACDSCKAFVPSKLWHFLFLHKCSLPYICSNCCVNDQGEFDFKAPLDRIQGTVRWRALNGNDFDEIFYHSAWHLKRQLIFQVKMSRDKLASELLGNWFHSSIC